ncbi:sialidase family protein [Membranihabitans marinus]|uniref:sialidase family protein n=1 Tax=Membranihabitans marinus TaxID=1227546 RepID=UPI001F3F928F|nr:sialidase family protein [Membranihabitans marinus]
MCNCKWKWGLAFFVLIFNINQEKVYAQHVNLADSIEVLWTGGQIPNREDLVQVEGVQFKAIKKYEPDIDGFKFLHGVAIVNFKNKWFVSFGHNKGFENTAGEVANSMLGENFNSMTKLIPVGSPLDNGAISHGVFYKSKNNLWSLMGSFEGELENVHTRAFKWNKNKKEWKAKGVIAEDGFWPLQEPIQMDNGKIIMAGFCVGGNNPPAVAIRSSSRVNSKWKVVKIPTSVKVWGESTIIVDGNEVILISRSGFKTPKMKNLPHPLAWVARSYDFGETWSTLKPSNLPMVASKPYAGILSTGQRYLISTNTNNSANERSPLTIALSNPGKNTFTKILKIRGGEVGNTDVESHPNAKLAYPYAVEYKGSLYVVYSNDGGKQGRRGEGRELFNNNSAELAIIPINQLN